MSGATGSSPAPTSACDLLSILSDSALPKGVYRSELNIGVPVVSSMRASLCTVPPPPPPKLPGGSTQASWLCPVPSWLASLLPSPVSPVHPQVSQVAPRLGDTRASAHLRTLMASVVVNDTSVPRVSTTPAYSWRYNSL